MKSYETLMKRHIVQLSRHCKEKAHGAQGNRLK